MFSGSTRRAVSLEKEYYLYIKQPGLPKILHKKRGQDWMGGGGVGGGGTGSSGDVAMGQ